MCVGQGMEVGSPWPITALLSVFYWNEGPLVLYHSLWVDLWKEAGWVGHFLSCLMLPELCQFGRATNLGFSGFVFLAPRQTLLSFLLQACSPGLHSELLVF